MLLCNRRKQLWMWSNQSGPSEEQGCHTQSQHPKTSLNGKHGCSSREQKQSTRNLKSETKTCWISSQHCLLHCFRSHQKHCTEENSQEDHFWISPRCLRSRVRYNCMVHMSGNSVDHTCLCSLKCLIPVCVWRFLQHCQLFGVWGVMYVCK